jgi:hypothetical protein
MGIVTSAMRWRMRGQSGLASWLAFGLLPMMPQNDQQMLCSRESR